MCKKKVWVYIIGKIGNLHDERNYNVVKTKFENRKKDLQELGYTVVCPLDSVLMHDNIDKTIKKRLILMLECEHVSTLSDYEESIESKTEYEVAKILRKQNIQPSIMNTYVNIKTEIAC